MELCVSFCSDPPKDISSLPFELMRLVFSNIKLEGLKNASAVSQRFAAVAYEVYVPLYGQRRYYFHFQSTKICYFFRKNNSAFIRASVALGNWKIDVARGNSSAEALVRKKDVLTRASSQKSDYQTYAVPKFIFFWSVVGNIQLRFHEYDNFLYIRS